MIEAYRNRSTKPLQVMLVEDDDGDGDAKAVYRAFKKAKVANSIVRARNGIEALALLRGEGEQTPLKKPFVLLVDLNMPQMGGLELIKSIREDSELDQSIIFVLTTSKREDDKNEAYGMNVAGYILKETAGEDFLRLFDMIDSYWKVVELPE